MAKDVSGVSSHCDSEMKPPNLEGDLPGKLDNLSPGTDEIAPVDLDDDRLHEMTASYSEISFDSQPSPPDGSESVDRSFDINPAFISQTTSIHSDSHDLFSERTFEGDSRRPDKLDLQRSFESGSGGNAFTKALENLQLEGTVSQEGDMVLFVAEDLETKIKLSSPVSRNESLGFPVSRSSTPSLYRQALTPQLPTIDSNVLNDLEIEARKVATSVDTLTENLAGILHSVSALTVDCLETYRDAVCKTCDAVDSNIKSMYQLMAKCEELSISMKSIYKLSENVKEIKRLLELFENAVSS
ncbi:BLOC-1-related complex subunit 6 [Ischnura elegans]|uniref:BLOC-1-related complex subunit 6 n=1 Tax=Ischnura elegans TaxID=197161 RepID=UPI001ED8A10D|nr:BLOC-1-related complex subunit 6 [Ischnura elegans]XP_046406004.1 BLOC-1-related complex subunit 6 [Ischnura elegans]